MLLNTRGDRKTTLGRGRGQKNKERGIWGGGRSQRIKKSKSLFGERGFNEKNSIAKRRKKKGKGGEGDLNTKLPEYSTHPSFVPAGVPDG